MKKLKNTVLTLVVLLSLVPFVSLNVFATDIYDVRSALTYADEHWNDETTDRTGRPDKDLCTDFVSHCFIKGNIAFSPETNVIGNHTGEFPRVAWDRGFNYYWGCWGLYHDLVARSDTEVSTLKQGETGKILWSQNMGRVSKGDVIFFNIKDADEYWNDEIIGIPDKNLCADFVSHCLIKGNIAFSPETDVIGNHTGEFPRVAWDQGFNAYYWGRWGLYHNLVARSDTEVRTLKQDETERILWSQNMGHVSKGDVIFFHIKDSDEHCNDEKTGGTDQGLCAEFVSHCLIKGNIAFSPETDVIGNRPGEFPRATWDPKFNAYYYWGCWGLYHDLVARSNTEVSTLAQDETGRILWSQNIGRVSKGDVIFFHIKDSDESDNDQYEHVVIVGNDLSEKYIKSYAHNVPKNNEPIEIREGREYICVHFKNAINLE